MVQKSSDPSELRRRGRPRQYDPERALTKAAEVFWKQGYAGTSLDDLAAATGMNRPSLYAAFGDKRELYLRTLQRYWEQARAMALKVAAESPTLRVFLKRFYEQAVDIYLAGGDEARGCYSISTAPAQATTDPAVRAFLAASIANTDSFLTNQIAKGRERGEVPSNAEPQALAQVATATLHAIAVRARVGVPRKELMALASAAINLICGPGK
jgi:TetR/AcrR family transcriptional regulator, copper-responsive repressor